MNEPRLLDVSQAAKRWNVCPDTIRRWIRAKRLTAIKTLGGGGWRIPETALPHRKQGSTSASST